MGTFLRYEGKAWNERFLPRMTFQQVEQLAKEDAVVILPIGSVEQLGPHMPLMTDALIGEALLTQAFEMLPQEAPLWLLPPIAYGKSNEHIGFAGTISLSAATLEAVLKDIAQSIKNSGFHKLLLFNTHGGNVDLMNVVIRDIRLETGLNVFYLAPHTLDSFKDLFTELELEYGLHGGDSVTSLMKSIKPDWVKEQWELCEYPNMSPYKFVTIENKIRFAWIMSDISTSGISGNATAGTAEKGFIMRDRMCNLLVEALLEMCRYTSPIKNSTSSH